MMRRNLLYRCHISAWMTRPALGAGFFLFIRLVSGKVLLCSVFFVLDKVQKRTYSMN